MLKLVFSYMFKLRRPSSSKNLEKLTKILWENVILKTRFPVTIFHNYSQNRENKLYQHQCFCL